MSFYTYVHRRADNGEVFYVGKGTGKRAYRTYHKDNMKWHDIVNKYGYKVEILDRFVDPEDALRAETELLIYYSKTGNLVNKSKVSIAPVKQPYKKYVTKPIDTSIYTQLGDIWVNLEDYNSRLEADTTTGCINVVRGSLHNQGYMMIGAIRESDRKRIMTTGQRIAGRIKAGRDLTEDEYVIHTCSNPKCHNQEHLIIGDRTDIHKVMKKNNRWHYGPRAEIKQPNRTYKTDVATMYWIANHTVKEAVARLGWRTDEVYAYRGKIKTFKWLHHFDTNGKIKPEYQHLYVDIS